MVNSLLLEKGNEEDKVFFFPREHTDVFCFLICTVVPFCSENNPWSQLIALVLSGSNVVGQILVPTHPDRGGVIHLEMLIRGKWWTDGMGRCSQPLFAVFKFEGEKRWGRDFTDMFFRLVHMFSFFGGLCLQRDVWDIGDTYTVAIASLFFILWILGLRDFLDL